MLHGAGDVRMSMGHGGVMLKGEKPMNSIDTLCTTNPTFTDLVLNPGFHVGMLTS